MNIYKLKSYIVISNISISSLVLLLGALMLLYQDGLTQSFSGKLHAGLNLSQLSGDGLNGFDNIGISSGFSISYPIGPTSKELSIELLYNRKGSKGTEPTTMISQSIFLNYVSTALLYRWGEWYNEARSYYNFHIEFGPVVSRLFNVQSSNSFYNPVTDKFNDWDIGVIGGINIKMNSKIGTTIRYERSLNKIYSPHLSNLAGLQSYLISIRLDYQL